MSYTFELKFSSYAEVSYDGEVVGTVQNNRSGDTGFNFASDGHQPSATFWDEFYAWFEKEVGE